MSRANSPTFPSLHLRHNSFSNPSVALPTSQLILQPFHRFTYATVHSWAELNLQPFHHFTFVTTHSPTLPLLMKSVCEQSSFSKLSHFTYVTANSDSPSFPSLHLRHSSFSNPSLALPTSKLILEPFRCFTYVTAHSPALLSLHLRHSSFSKPSVASPTSAHSPTLLSLLLRHRIFTYVTWRAAHEQVPTVVWSPSKAVGPMQINIDCHEWMKRSECGEHYILTEMEGKKKKQTMSERAWTLPGCDWSCPARHTVTHDGMWLGSTKLPPLHGEGKLTLVWVCFKLFEHRD